MLIFWKFFVKLNKFFLFSEVEEVGTSAGGELATQQTTMIDDEQMVTKEEEEQEATQTTTTTTETKLEADDLVFQPAAIDPVPAEAAAAVKPNVSQHLDLAKNIQRTIEFVELVSTKERDSEDDSTTQQEEITADVDAATPAETVNNSNSPTTTTSQDHESETTTEVLTTSTNFGVTDIQETVPNTSTLEEVFVYLVLVFVFCLTIY